jgi:hypothetical protein
LNRQFESSCSQRPEQVVKAYGIDDQEPKSRWHGKRNISKSSGIGIKRRPSFLICHDTRI